MDAQRNHYIQRVNTVLDHITTHLTEDLTLKNLADVAGFSEFHFHRVFKSIVGETVSQFVWRARVERGASLLRSKPTMTVSTAAIDCGFTSLAGFSRAFKARFGLSPTHWDRQSRLQNDPLLDANNLPTYRITELEDWHEAFPVQFEDLPAQRLAYIRVYDSYSDVKRIERAYHTLLGWYVNCGGRLSETTLYGMSQDDPHITPQAQCRFDWCLRVPADWRGDHTINVRDFPACLLVTVELDGKGIEHEDRILQYLWRYWLPRSDYQPANLPAMEIYRRFPHENGWWDALHMACAIPVIRL